MSTIRPQPDFEEARASDLSYYYNFFKEKGINVDPHELLKTSAKALQRSAIVVQAGVKVFVRPKWAKIGYAKETND